MKLSGLYYGYWLVGAAFVAQFIAIGMYSYVLGPFMTPMTEELGWSRADFTLTRSIGQIVMALLGIYIGARVDRIGGRPIMFVGTTVLTITLILHQYVETLWGWWILNGVMLTAGSAMVGNLVVNVTLSKWFVVNRGKAIAFAAMGVSFGGIVLTPLATWLIDEIGWRMAWVWLGVMAAACLYPVAFLIRRSPEDYGLHPDGMSEADVNAGANIQAQIESANTHTRAEALRTFSFYALVIAFGFFTINIVVVILHSVPYLTDHGFSRNEAAMSMFIASIPAMISKPFWGALIDRYPAKPLAAISASVTGVSLFLIIYAVNADVLVWIYAAYVLLGLGWGGMIPMQEVIWASFFGRKHIGAIRGAGMPFTLALGAVAPWAVSYYYDLFGTYDGGLITVATLNVISGVLIFLVPKPVKKEKDADE